jgi:hypothetical protein
MLWQPFCLWATLRKRRGPTHRLKDKGSRLKVRTLRLKAKDSRPKAKAQRSKARSQRLKAKGSRLTDNVQCQRPIAKGLGHKSKGFFCSGLLWPFSSLLCPPEGLGGMAQ